MKIIRNANNFQINNVVLDTICVTTFYMCHREHLIMKKAIFWKVTGKAAGIIFIKQGSHYPAKPRVERRREPIMRLYYPAEKVRFDNMDTWSIRDNIRLEIRLDNVDPPLNVLRGNTCDCPITIHMERVTRRRQRSAIISCCSVNAHLHDKA